MPSIKFFVLEIFVLNERADKILILAKASYPFKSNLGLTGSAYPSFCALNNTFFETIFSFFHLRKYIITSSI